MAEANASQEKQQDKGFFAAAGKLIESVRTQVNPVISYFSEPLLRDGMVGGAWRQGAEEFWQLLKAFPDTIQAQASGTLMNPTQGEVAEGRRPAKPATLKEVLAMDTSNVPQQENGQDQGLSM
jgi:hypothetical protein